ncbi:MAG TPA: biotin--[acetyl-CoA-carboxylase] ligase [Gaiellaceae bacterium]|nr:biotin--[acetyl-CoA-carboxylase] ligase [Gaiellaceae bacterium]
MADSLAYESVDRHLKGRFGRPYTYAAKCESTQLLLEGAPEGAVAACDVQTAGRGRYGRAWEAPPGTALLCSIVLHPPSARDAPELTLVGAIAAAEAVEGATGLSAQIKWPNDVMLDRRKVGGVLGELRDGVVTLGIGLNVNQAREQLPADARTPPGSLRTITGARYDRAALLGSLLFRLERLYDEWRHGGLAEVFVEIGPRDFLRGRTVAVNGTSGVAVGIDREGRLEIDLGHGERIAVESGEVSYQR